MSKGTQVVIILGPTDCWSDWHFLRAHSKEAHRATSACACFLSCASARSKKSESESRREMYCNAAKCAQPKPRSSTVLPDVVLTLCFALRLMGCESTWTTCSCTSAFCTLPPYLS